MFNDLKFKISNYILRKDVLNSKHSPKLIELSRAKKVAVLFDAHDSKSIVEVKYLLKYFLKLNIDVAVLGFVNEKQNASFHISTLHINYFNLNDTSFLGFPKSNKITSFLREEYDFLINLSLTNSFPTKYLTFNAKTNYRIGIDTLDPSLNYDLMFKIKVKRLNYLIKNIIHYLELIDRNNEK